MKTLDLLEPATPLIPGRGGHGSGGVGSEGGGQRAAALVITTPGSYFLTGNVTVGSGDNGIEVRTSNVTLDLRGFSVVGLVGSLDGVATPVAGIVNVRVFNGNVRGMGGDGIDMANAYAATIENIRVGNCTGDGVRLGTGTITHCFARRCADGFDAAVNSTLVRCKAELNAIGFRLGDHSVVTECSAVASTDSGFQGGTACTFSRCSASSGTGSGVVAGQRAVVEACAADGNALVGISIGGGGCVTGTVVSNNTLGGLVISEGGVVRDSSAQANNGPGFILGVGACATGCAALGNGAEGFQLSGGSLAADCTAHSNATTGFVASGAASVQRCVAAFNTLSGFFINSGEVVDCVARGNSAVGIQVASTALVRGNLCVLNLGTAGIKVTGNDCRVEGNNCVGNVRGIDVDGAGNFIVANSCSGNSTANYEIAGSNTDAAQATPGAGFSITTPWTNFVY